MSPRELLDRYFFNVFLITFIYFFLIFLVVCCFFSFFFSHTKHKIHILNCSSACVFLWLLFFGAMGHLPYEEKTNYKIFALKGNILYLMNYKVYFKNKSFYDYICFLKLLCFFWFGEWVFGLFNTSNVIPNEIMKFFWRNEMHSEFLDINKQI